MNSKIKCGSCQEYSVPDCEFLHTEYWREKTCPVCGKIFYPPSDEWGYREGETLICSWHCLCELRRGAAFAAGRICRRSGKASSPRLNAEQLERRNENIRFDFAQGDSVKTLECRYGLSYTHIKRIISAAPTLSEAKAESQTAEGPETAEDTSCACKKADAPETDFKASEAAEKVRTSERAVNPNICIDKVPAEPSARYSEKNKVRTLRTAKQRTAADKKLTGESAHGGCLR